MPIVSDSKFEKSFFFLYFFNKDYLSNFPWNVLKLLIHVNEDYLERTVSQNFDLGPSFNFMNS